MKEFQDVHSLEQLHPKPLGFHLPMTPARAALRVDYLRWSKTRGLPTFELVAAMTDHAQIVLPGKRCGWLGSCAETKCYLGVSLSGISCLTYDAVQEPYETQFFRIVLSNYRLMQDSATCQDIMPLGLTPRWHFTPPSGSCKRSFAAQS